MGDANNECLTCVSEITEGFQWNGTVDPRAWEKSLALSMCKSGMQATQIGSIVLELRFLMFLHRVSSALGMAKGDVITNPTVIAYLKNLFGKGLMPQESADRLRSAFPGSPWKVGAVPPSSPPDPFDFGF